MSCLGNTGLDDCAHFCRVLAQGCALEIVGVDLALEFTRTPYTFYCFKFVKCPGQWVFQGHDKGQVGEWEFIEEDFS